MRAEWVKLASFGTGLEADMARATLEEGGVPVQVRGHQNGSFGLGFQGVVPTGVDLYVPSLVLAEARELLGVDV